MSAFNRCGDEIKLRQAGTQIKLPSHDVTDGFTVNAADTVFTVPDKGIYFISYRVCLDCEAVLTSSVARNNTAIEGLETAPSQPQNCYSCQSIVKLSKGNKLCLTLAGTGTVKLQNGAGAYLNIIRLA